MKVLLTGGTGFLGKRVLELLLNDSRIERVEVLSRSKRSHPHPKARIHKIDLSASEDLNRLPTDVDAVIHLAGLYDFSRNATENYTHNVLASSNLLETLRSSGRSESIPILLASSYVVGLGGDPAESYARSLPSEEFSYAYSKALSERLVVDSGRPCSAFRLGILVGDKNHGSIEKLDGPYFLAETLRKLSRITSHEKVRKFLPFALPLPLPADPDRILPLVPVDIAARVFHEALFHPATFEPGARIYGVYHPDSVKVRDFCGELTRALAPSMRPAFLGPLSKTLAARQEVLTGLPGEALRTSGEPIDLDDSRFKQDFPGIEVPRFESYKESFVRGFLEFRENRTS